MIQANIHPLSAKFFMMRQGEKNGVRPAADQPFPNDMKVECAKAIRSLPLGTKVKLSVVETEKEGSRPFLYSSYKWAYDIIK